MTYKDNLVKHYSTNELINEALTDKIAYQVLDEEADSKILRVAETKVEYLKKQKSSNK
jgi:hypothetical protein